MRLIPIRTRRHGFTIVELMVATSVFATVLLIISAGVIKIGNTYYQGLNRSSTQNTAASVVDTISQSLQLSSDSIVSAPGTTGPNAKVRVYCVGKGAFGYVPGTVLKSGPSSLGNMGLYRIDRSNLSSPCGSADTVDNFMNRMAASAGQQLLTENMRVTKFAITDANTANASCGDDVSGKAVLCKISLTIAFGNGGDLFCDARLATGVGSCAPDAAKFPAGSLESDVQNNDTADIRCRTANDSHFCAISALNTVVQRRL